MKAREQWRLFPALWRDLGEHVLACKAMREQPVEKCSSASVRRSFSPSCIIRAWHGHPCAINSDPNEQAREYGAGYLLSKFRTKPSPASYKDAAKHPAVLYQRLVQHITQFQACLAAGYPFVFGFAVYESFESMAVARSGRVPMPSLKNA